MGKFDAELIKTAATIATPGRGILAADESTGTIGSRFQNIGVPNEEHNRRGYRELLFGTKDIGKFISGAILFEETLYQKAEDGTPFVDLLRNQGVVIGIKVDKGTVNIPGTDAETSTQGLDGLADRVKKYYESGARFAKWRAVLKIGAGQPTELAIHENAWGLARYAAICQENGLVPIVEPEILMDGDHSIEVSADVTERVLAAVFKALSDNHILLEGILLKPNMVSSGSSHPKKSTPEEVAKYTVRTLQRTVPPAVPGIMFLSGGQGEIEATSNLNAMNALNTRKPWILSFSYGRALQSSVLKAWKGEKGHVEAARKVFAHRALVNGLATLGKYEGEEVTAEATESLFVKGYIY